jgi:hypothetical protein
MSIPLVKLKLALVLLPAIFCLDVQADEIPHLDLTHQLIDTEQQADGRTVLVFELNARNEGMESLSGINLRFQPSIPILADHQETAVLGAITGGQSTSLLWHATALGPIEDYESLFQQISFGAEAQDSMGTLLTFPLESTEEQP